MVAAAVIGGVAAVGSAAIQSSAASSAASKQANAANNATAAQENMFNTTQQNLQPYITQGGQVSTQISNLEGLNGGSNSNIMSTLEQLPGYQFAEQQGLKSTQNAATANGLGVSGSALKSAAAYSTGLANQYYNNYLSGLQSTQTTDANAAGGLASTSAQVGSNIAGTQQAAGAAQAAGILGSANAVSGGLNSLQNAFYANKILGGQNGVAGFGSQVVDNPLGLSSGSNFTPNDIASISADFDAGA